MKKQVLVTGANGFVGRQLCDLLVRHNWHVRGVVRSADAVAVLPPGVQPLVIPDIVHNTDWPPLLDGVNSVVHLVARTHVLRDRASDRLQAYRRINVEGTKQLAIASIQAGVSRFVFMSSIKAVGEGSPEVYTETSAFQPSDAYGISKLEAEQALLRVAEESDLEPVILRPPLVYGPYVQGNFLRLLRAVQRGIPLPLGAVHNARSMVFVKNLADAVRASLEHPAAAGEVFHVADPVSLGTRELLARLAKILERAPATDLCSAAVAKAVRPHDGRSGEVERLLGSLTVSSSKVREYLGWSPPHDVDEGLRDTVAWFNDHGQSKSVPAVPKRTGGLATEISRAA